MKTVIASILMAFAAPALAQTTIYKHVDDSGRVTYSNKPMKGAVTLDLEPLTTIPARLNEGPTLRARGEEAPKSKERVEASPVEV